MNQESKEVERLVKAYEDTKRQLKTFSEQGEIGVKIAKGILNDLVLKGALSEDLADMIALELKIK